MIQQPKLRIEPHEGMGTMVAAADGTKIFYKVGVRADPWCSHTAGR
ncbi:MAG: hypothetical protein NVSMB64_25590 [Candidatus Velthaea sp.]